jgi:hypothetical protein
MPSRSRRLWFLKWVSTALAILVAGFWVGSIWYEVSWHDASLPPHDFVIGGGCVRYYHIPFADRARFPSTSEWRFSDATPGGFEWLPSWKVNSSGTPAPGSSLQLEILGLPLWPAAGLFAVLGALLFARAARAGRRGRCPSCGYDHRGLAAAAACPECGTVPARG